jgi:hypothetical protein
MLLPGVFIPGMLPVSCFFVARLFLVATLFVLSAVFRFALALGFGIFIPGMFCMSWPCAMTLAVDVSIRPIMMTTLNPDIRMKAPRLNLFMVPPLIFLAEQKHKRWRERTHTKAHVRFIVSDDSLWELNSEDAD